MSQTHARTHAFKDKGTSREETRSRSYRFQSGPGSGFEYKDEKVDGTGMIMLCLGSETDEIGILEEE
jgi:hypothetical protein